MVNMSNNTYGIISGIPMLDRLKKIINVNLFIVTNQEYYYAVSIDGTGYEELILPSY